VSPEEAVTRWRRYTQDELATERATNQEFREALKEAGKQALASNDPRDRFWDVDVDGWRKYQYTVDTPPARPNEDDEFGPGAHLRKGKNVGTN
jgi:hypothetical protein